MVALISHVMILLMFILTMLFISNTSNSTLSRNNTTKFTHNDVYKMELADWLRNKTHIINPIVNNNTDVTNTTNINELPLSS